MTARVYPVDAVSDAPEYSGRAIRQMIGGLLWGKTSSRPLGARSGVLGPEPDLSVTSTKWGVGSFAGVIDGQLSAQAGPYLFAFDGDSTDSDQSGDVTAANATNPRWDRLDIVVSDPAEDSTTTPGIEIKYTAGTAASSPSLPDAPDRSTPLGKIVVPASGDGDPTITFLGQYAAAFGGIVPVSTITGFDDGNYSGEAVYAQDENLLYLWDDDAGSWKSVLPDGPRGIIGKGSEDGPSEHTSSAFADVTDIAKTGDVTIVSGREYRVRATVGSCAQTYASGDGFGLLAISRSGSELSSVFNVPSVDSETGISAFAEFVGSGITEGTWTFALRAWCGANVTNIILKDVSVTVEDLGPSL